MGKLLRRLSYLLNRNRLDAELAEEIEAHRAMVQERLEQSGTPRTHAASRSRRALGNVTLAREDARDLWGFVSLDQLWRDLKFALRLLRVRPAFTVTALLTLAVGVGATTTVATIVNSELWRPLPFSEADRLVAVSTTGPQQASTVDPVSIPDFLDWKAQNQVFEDLGAWRWPSRHIFRGAHSTEAVRVLPVTSNFFDVLRRPPAIGRTFVPADETAGAIVLSNTGWRRLFAADPSVVGNVLTLDDQIYTIVGVSTPEPLDFVGELDMFQVIDASPAAAAGRNVRGLVAFARLKPGVSVAGADAAMREIGRRLATEYPSDHVGRSTSVADLREVFTGSNWRALTLFLIAAMVVLALSCVNVANLLLTRAIGRRREFALRSALGGGRTAVFRQLFVEGALLAIPGAAAGILLSRWTLALLAKILPTNFLTRQPDFSVDVRIVAGVVGIACAATILFALAPVIFASRRDVSEMLAGAGRPAAASKGERRARSLLVISEVTLALVLLVAAGLFLNSFVRLTHLPVGFEASGRLMLRVPMSGDRYAQANQVTAYGESLLGEIAALPGVQSVALASSGPLESGSSAAFIVADRPRPAVGVEPKALIRAISPAFFTTLGIRQVAGRAFTPQDTAGGRRVAMINEHLARRFYHGENPVGRSLELLPRGGPTWLAPGTVEIVGVVSNIKDVGMNEVDFNGVYLPHAQAAAPAISVYVHSSVAHESLTGTIRDVVRRLDASLPIVAMLSMEQRVDNAMRGDRFNLALVGSFAALATLLAAVGIYGAMASATAQRTQEFGVRLALGAQRVDVLRLALGQAIRLGTIGTAIGLGASLALARVLGDALYVVQGQHEGVLYGVGLSDPITLASACTLVLGVAAIAGLIPARRATRVDPVIALRSH